MNNNNLTSNLNLLSPTGFKLTINRSKYANIEFFITTFSIPDISISPIQIHHRGTSAYSAGESMTFGDLSLRFAIDEDMNNYSEIYNWLESNVKSSSDDKQIDQHDMILSIMSSHNNVNKQFQFKNAFPITLSGVEFSTQSTSVDYLQADVSFRYDEFLIIK
jgi:hypothetical protein